MELISENEQHKRQVQAGTEGRISGHKFEELVSIEVNRLKEKDLNSDWIDDSHIYIGNPGKYLVTYIAKDRNKRIKRISSYWLGGLATANVGDNLVNGSEIKHSKSDIVIEFEYYNEGKEYVGVSIKSCSHNAQLALTSASGFCKMLRDNGIEVSDSAEKGLKMFCGDVGYRPMDAYEPYNTENISKNRKARPERWYWEELPTKEQKEWESIFNQNQVKITKLLMQTASAYKNDPFKPQYILHECKKHTNLDECMAAILSIDEFAAYSEAYSKFGVKEKRIGKGSYLGIDLALHKYPYFGFIQFQPIGNKQNFSELQFNIMASYYKKLKDLKKS